MAVRHGYGKIAGADALVFAYDTGDIRNSYRGRPTTNYGPVSFGSWGTENTAQRIATGNTYNGQPTYNCRTTLGASWQGIDTTISGLRTAAGSSGTVTMSCMVRNNNSTSYPMYAYIGHDFGSTRTIAANSDWQKVQWTVNQSNMNNDYVEFRPYTNTADVYLEMTMPMVEVNVTYASQFTTGTRSSTQGLLDLTGNSTIDLANVSFDANAQIDFDGTNDGIDLGAGHTTFTNKSFAVEAIFYPNTSPPAAQVFFAAVGPVGGFQKNIHFRIYSSGAYRMGFLSNDLDTAGGVVTFGEYNHVVMQYDYNSDTSYIYVNGQLNVSGNQGPFTDSSAQIGIGYWPGSGQYFNGEIPVFKIYNRVLTAAEVRNNYNQYKGRFNI